MQLLNIVLIPVIISAALIYILQPGLTTLIGGFLRRFTGMPDSDELKNETVSAFFRVIRFNWYTFLLLFLLWGLLFTQDIGKDIIDVYLSNFKDFELLERFLSYLSLFLCVLAMSLSIWSLPFFMFSKNKEEEITSHTVRFYLATKILAFVAMLPFLIVTNAFLLFAWDLSWLPIVGINLGSLVVFLALILLIRTKPFEHYRAFMNKIYHPLQHKISNRYLYIVVRIFISVFFVTFFAAVAKLDILSQAYLSTIYLFICSGIVFRLLFFTDESKTDRNRIDQLVLNMVGEANKRNSKQIYLWLIRLLSLATLYYYLVPSLEGTNTLYILLVVFSFFIIYLDFWRNLFRNGTRFWKVISAVFTILFIVIPFIPVKEQFAVHFTDYHESSPKRMLKAALLDRYHQINSNDSAGNVYIICAMGGGSRAAYITASVLTALDRTYPDLFNRTLCYSTVSGGTVGTYTYLKGRDLTRSRTDTGFLEYNFRKNYNSSGVFSLLIGDAIETLLGPIVTKPRGWLMKHQQRSPYYDRNVRLRTEYDFVLQQSLENGRHKGAAGYLYKTFYSLWADSAITNDYFQAYFNKKGLSVPIHFINTFEVNSGQRAVLTPFPVFDALAFPNALLPLQDTNFDLHPLLKDISYREAVNMSELFPLVSAASQIGTRSKAQFVDGGYFENYGLATGMDIFYFLRDSIPEKRLKIILIKNSPQLPTDTAKKSQFFAPVSGVLNAPFTGHANHLAARAVKVLGRTNFLTITFNADSMKVPLTRSLTQRHIDSMRVFIEGISDDQKIKSFLQNSIGH